MKETYLDIEKFSWLKIHDLPQPEVCVRIHKNIKVRLLYTFSSIYISLPAVLKITLYTLSVSFKELHLHLSKIFIRLQKFHISQFYQL